MKKANLLRFAIGAACGWAMAQRFAPLLRQQASVPGSSSAGGAGLKPESAERGVDGERAVARAAGPFVAASEAGIPPDLISAKTREESAETWKEPVTEEAGSAEPAFAPSANTEPDAISPEEASSEREDPATLQFSSAPQPDDEPGEAGDPNVVEPSPEEQAAFRAARSKVDSRMKRARGRQRRAS